MCDAIVVRGLCAMAAEERNILMVPNERSSAEEWILLHLLLVPWADSICENRATTAVSFNTAV